MRRYLPVVAVLCILAWCGPAMAQAGWTDYRSPDQAFAVQFPGAPGVTSKPVAGKTPVTEYQYQYATPALVYCVTVIQFTSGQGPDHPDNAYLSGLVAAYARGSKTTLISQNPKTVAGRPSLEAVTEDAAKNRFHLLDVFVSGARVYLIVSEGPKGHETSADAKRFRDSFKLLGP
jgi:hypothetical protein